MDDFSGALLRATKAATCDMLQTYGSAAPALTALALAEPTPVVEAVALGSGIAQLVAGWGCSWDPAGPAPPNGSFVQGCQSIAGGTGSLYLRNFGDPTVNIVRLATGVVSATAYTTTDEFYNIQCFVAHYPDGTSEEFCYVNTVLPNPPSNPYFCFLEANSGTCDPAPYAPPAPAPYTYIDQSTSCTLEVTFQGWAVSPGDQVAPVMKIEPAATLRTGGGIIQGCNFQPVIYQPPPGGGGGGGTTIPWYDGPDNPDGTPWWIGPLTAAVGGIVGGLVNQLLDELLTKQVAGKVYRITSVCETNSAGEPVSESVEVDIPTVGWDEAVIWRLDALEHIMQGLKDFKQPICRPSKGQGDLVTVHFESDEPSIAGERPLRKTLNYRDQMASDLAAHAAHWENFAWEAGDVIVYHEGAAWGKLTVWANSADEGKRVIRHAGTISGVNPDAEGEWAVTHSSSARYGRTGTMRLAKRKSAQGMVLRISKRGGPDGLPIVPVDPAP